MLHALRAALLPSLAILVAVVAAALPWGLPAAVAFVPPLLTGLLVFLFAVQRQALLAPWFVFVAGILHDLLTGGPVGYWALVFLAAHGTGRGLPIADVPRPRPLLLPRVILASAGMASAAWLAASGFYVRLVDWQPFLISVLASTALYPLLWRLARLGRRRWMWAES